MITLVNNLYEQLVSDLRETETRTDLSPAQQRENALQRINEAIAALKELVIHHTFADEQEEIMFFKHLKPKFTAQLIYYSRLALIVLKKPLGSLQDVRSHYEQELLLIRVFYEHHVQLYQYMLAEATFLDTKLFVRGNADLPYHCSTSSVDADTRFTTHYDYVIARIEANKRLANYLLQALRELESGRIAGEEPEDKKGLAWTGSKVYLTELIYGLYESGQINNGNAGLLEIAGQLETFFQVRLGNVYRTFQEVRQRKKDSRTKFLNLMQERLLHRMEELDGG